ncbi:MAG: ThiF family adenylyltransferase [Planctomycetaceae bacterium]|jgi:adenylyltransferase/sulfurtransferase|nr:ThiF family adenylyltransferase [Planctomycetaceae bacterium]
MMSNLRYSRQIAFFGVGVDGQDKLLASTVAIIGVGAIGSALANILCRAGIGRLRLVDRDYVELTNLQRQILFTEADVTNQQPKSIAACEYLKKVNSEIILEPVVAELNSGNIAQILDGVDLILDAVDNWETRFLINEWSVKNKITWIYAAALGSQCVTMNFRYNNTCNNTGNNTGGDSNNSCDSNSPCLRCLIPAEHPQTQQQTCATAGILAMTPGTIASIQAAEAVKIILNSNAIREGLLTIDLWNNRFKNIKIKRNPDCPVCSHKIYDYLSRNANAKIQKICGRNAIQISPESQTNINLIEYAKKLEKIGNVKTNQYILNFTNDNLQFTLFQDGRAIIENPKNEIHAKNIYNEFIGLR